MLQHDFPQRFMVIAEFTWHAHIVGGQKKVSSISYMNNEYDEAIFNNDVVGFD